MTPLYRSIALLFSLAFWYVVIKWLTYYPWR
jgi:hypothetical protein